MPRFTFSGVVLPPHYMVTTGQGPSSEGRPAYLLLLGLLLITTPVLGAGLRASPTATLTNDPSALCSTVTPAEVLAGRYPDPEALIVPARCKEQARQLVRKWQQQDLYDLPKLAAEACVETASAQTEWLLKKELVKLDRQSVLAELSCGCSAEILAQATNPPAPPGIVKVVTDSGQPSEKPGQNAALTPIRYTSQVLAKKAGLVISHNAAELLSLISGKLVKGLSAEQFDSELSGQWNNQYRAALRALVHATSKLQTLSVELDTTPAPKVAASTQTNGALPEIVRALIEQTRLLSLAYDGIVREHELPWGQCYETFAIRHQLIINSVAPLISKTPSASKTR